MRRRGLKAVGLFFGVVAVGLSAQRMAYAVSDASSQALDGKVFVGEIGAQGKAAGDPDEFHFQRGAFRSTACDPYGFGEAAYTTALEADAMTFQSQAVSPTDGTMTWNGTVRGDVLEGTATWEKPGKAPEEYWFKGTLKP